MVNFNDYTDEELAVIKIKSEQSLLFFIRFWFKILRGSKFLMNWHHEEMSEGLEEAAQYLYDFINFNVPPRHSKTEMVGINFPAWSLAKNPRGNFLYITASDELRSETSVRIRDIVQHPLFYKLYGVKIKRDQSAKNLWRTDTGGGLKTATIFGQITGFGAGRLVDKELVEYIEEFEGAIILDDINKIIDSVRDNSLNQKALDTIFNTILSRKNNEETPIINIQQRTGGNDATAVLLEHFEGKKVKSIVLPVIYDDKPLWAKKLDWPEIKHLRDSPFTKNTFVTQYMQDPDSADGGKFKDEYFEIITAKQVPSDIKWQMFIDGAYTKKTSNDPTGVMICAKSGGDLYIKISVDRWLGLPKLLKFIKTFAVANDFLKRYRIFVEPKASGISLKQFLNKKGYNAQDIKTIYNGLSKEERAEAALPFCESRKVKLVEGSWTKPFLKQLRKFPNDKHDEHVDLISYAIIINYLTKQKKKKITNTSQLGI